MIVRVGIPARWPLPAQQLAGAWLQGLFAPHVDAGLKAAGQSRAMASTARPAVQVHVHPVESAEAYWLLMEQQLQQWQRERQPGLLWALVADSLVGEASVEQLARTHELFSGQRQQGRVPGEGAAGVLLASPSWAAPADAAPPLALMHKASLAKRDKSADASGRITSQALLQAVDDTLQPLHDIIDRQLNQMVRLVDDRAGGCVHALLEVVGHLSYGVAGPEQRGRAPVRGEEPDRSAPDDLPSAGTFERIDAGMLPTDGHASRRHLRAGNGPPGNRQARIQSVQRGQPRAKPRVRAATRVAQRQPRAERHVPRDAAGECGAWPHRQPVTVAAAKAQ